MSQNPTSQTFQEKEIVIFKIAGLPTFMYSEERFWVSLKTISQWLGIIEKSILLSGEVITFLNDSDAGMYAPLDDLISMCPKETQVILNKQRQNFIAMMGGE